MNILMTYRRIYEYVALFFSDPKKVMWLTFTIGVICSVISILFTKSIYRDSIQYAAMVNGFNIGDWDRAFREWLPPLYPFFCGLLCKIGFSVYYSMLTVASILCVLTIFPLYGSLSFFMEKKYAAWGALFYMIAPKVLRLGLSPLLEGGKYFFFALSFYFVLKFSKSKKILDLIWCGIALAFLALIRGEGMLYIPVVFFALVLLSFKDNDFKINNTLIKNISIYGVILLITISAVLSPRLYQVYKQTGYPAIDTRQVKAFVGFGKKIFGKEINNSFVKGNGLALDYDISSSCVGDFTLKKSLGEFIKSFSRGTYELYLAIGILGVLMLIMKKKWNIYYTVTVWLFLSNLLIFCILEAFTYRYYLINILILMPFTIAGYVQLLVCAEKYRVKHFFVIVIAGAAVFQIVNGMDNVKDTQKLYYKEMSYWIKDNNSNLKNPQNKDLTILAYGSDFGYGLYSNSNVVNYMDIADYRLNDVMTKGFSAKLCYYAMTKTPVEITLKPDIVVIDNVATFKSEIKYLKSQPNVAQIHTKWDDKIQVFKNNN